MESSAEQNMLTRDKLQIKRQSRSNGYITYFFSGQYAYWEALMRTGKLVTGLTSAGELFVSTLRLKPSIRAPEDVFIYIYIKKTATATSKVNNKRVKSCIIT
jgi:hypothetical protein